jgi:hypothetical protein
MLASIHPLGERARGRRWGITVTAFVTGASAAGAAAGGLLGQVGAALARGPGLPLAAAVATVAVVALIGTALDLGWAGLQLPTVRRQVNEDWLRRYRGAVYGFGFGVQLGVGVATIVTTAAVYLTFVIALLSASPAAGAVIGAAFGLARGASLFAVAGVETPEQLWARHRRIQGWERHSRRFALVVPLAAAAVLVAAA